MSSGFTAGATNRGASWTRPAEHELLDRASAAFAAVGLPPGVPAARGAVTSRTELLLRRGGYRWYSPAGTIRRAGATGWWSVPFSWTSSTPIT